MMFNSYSYGYGIQIHAIFMLMALFGLVGALVWMARFANKGQMKTIVLTTLIVGILGSLLTAAMATRGMRSMMEDWEGWDDQDESIDSEKDLGDEEAKDMEDFRDEMMGIDEESQ